MHQCLDARALFSPVLEFQVEEQTASGIAGVDVLIEYLEELVFNDPQGLNDDSDLIRLWHRPPGELV
jgi:hypothetical protein